MSYLLNSAFLAAGGSPYVAMAVHDEDKSDLFSPRFYWSYQQRGPRTTQGQVAFFDGWSKSGMLCGDATVNPGATQFGQDAAEFGQWDLPQVSDSGQIHLSAISGQCLNASSVPQINALVQAFLTSTGALAGSTYSDNNGNYVVTTPYLGQAHFLVALLAGSPDIFGTTDNNLTPTLL